MEIGFIGFIIALGIFSILENTKPMQKIFEKLYKLMVGDLDD